MTCAEGMEVTIETLSIIVKSCLGTFVIHAYNIISKLKPSLILSCIILGKTREMWLALPVAYSVDAYCLAFLMIEYKTPPTICL